MNISHAVRTPERRRDAAPPPVLLRPAAADRGGGVSLLPDSDGGPEPAAVWTAATRR